MNNIVLFLRAIRPLNLCFIALTQYLVRYVLILPVYEEIYQLTGMYPLNISELYFFLLVFSTMMIAAVGYILNDALDAKIDSINKPGKKSITTIISRTTAINIFLITGTAAILIAFFLAESVANLWLGGIQVAAVTLLALYSSHLKKIILLGNVAIALLSAMVPLLAGLYEPSIYDNFDYIYIYAGFAFLISLIREIAKDAEDEEGDSAAGRNTIPVVLGRSTTKVVLSILTFVTAVAGGKVLVHYFYGYDMVRFWKIFSCFEILLAALFVMVILAREKKDFSHISAFSKLIMLIGILSLIPLYYFIIN